MFITAMSLTTNDITCQCLKANPQKVGVGRLEYSEMDKSPGFQVNSVVQRSLPYAIRQRVHVRLECILDDMTCLEEGTVRRVDSHNCHVVGELRSAVDQ